MLTLTFKDGVKGLINIQWILRPIKSVYKKVFIVSKECKKKRRYCFRKLCDESANGDVVMNWVQ